MPGFALLDGEVYYLYETYNDKKCGFGIKKADLNKPETVVEEKNYRLSEPDLYSNGRDFAILVRGKILIGNAKGIYREYNLPEKLSDFGICKDYLFCNTTSDGNKWTARSISLKTGKEYTAESKTPLYRISGMNGDELTCIGDSFHDMYILRPGKKLKMVPIEESQEISVNLEYVRYYPYGDTKTLAQISDTKFCQVTW